MKWIYYSIEKSPGFNYIKPKVDEIIKNRCENPSLSIELCKALIESVCKTILTDKGLESDLRFPNLISSTINSLNLENHRDEVHLKELAKRLGQVLQYIGEIRNKEGDFASHGQDYAHKGISADLSLFALNATNAILGFILYFYIVTNDYQKSNRWKYEDYGEFNEFLDEEYPMDLSGGCFVSYSKALFEQNNEKYKEYYLDYLYMKRDFAEDTL